MGSCESTGGKSAETALSHESQYVSDLLGVDPEVMAVAERAVAVARQCRDRGAGLFIEEHAPESRRVENGDLRALLKAVEIEDGDITTVAMRESDGAIVCRWIVPYEHRTSRPLPAAASSAGDVAIVSAAEKKPHVVYTRHGGRSSRFGPSRAHDDYMLGGEDTDKPARVCDRGVQSWYFRGELHGSPAVRCSCSLLEAWAENGCVGRPDGPALVGPAAGGVPAVEAYARGGLLDRPDGPALVVGGEEAHFASGVRTRGPGAESGRARDPAPPAIKEILDAGVFEHRGFRAIREPDRHVIFEDFVKGIPAPAWNAERYARARVNAHRAWFARRDAAAKEEAAGAAAGAAAEKAGAAAEKAGAAAEKAGAAAEKAGAAAEKAGAASDEN